MKYPHVLGGGGLLDFMLRKGDANADKSIFHKNNAVDFKELLSYTTKLKIYYKVVQELPEETDKYYSRFIWNIEQVFSYSERARITATAEFELYGVASSARPGSHVERYVLNGAILLLALSSLILQVQQFMTSDRMLRQTLESIKRQLATIQRKKEEKVNDLLQQKISNLVKGAFSAGSADGGGGGPGAAGGLTGLLGAKLRTIASKDDNKEDGTPGVDQRDVSSFGGDAGEPEAKLSAMSGNAGAAGVLQG